MEYVIFIVGGFVVTILSVLSGGGASLLLMPLVGLVAGAKAIAPSMTLGIAISSSSRVFYFWRDIDWKLFRWLAPGTVIGAVLGARLFAELDAGWIQLLIALYLLTTVVQFNQKPKAGRFRIKTWHFAPIGLVIAFLSGLIGGVGPLMNSAYLSYGASKETLIGTRSTNAVLLHLVKIGSYVAFGVFTREALEIGLMLGAASVLGNYLGKRLLSRISEVIFRKVVVGTMVFSGALMLWDKRAMIADYLEVLR